MSTFTTSRGTRCQHIEPKFQSAPYRQHPSRREHIYGKVQPMNGELRADMRLIIGGAVFALLLVLILSTRGI